MAEQPETIMDQREQFMISPQGGKPMSKMSHFINPTLSLTENPPELPTIPLPFIPVFPKCTFNGWRNPTRQWISWVDRLRSSYQCIWKRAGIYDAVLSSRYKITRNDDLFFGLVERWSAETNTFVFPWGEATVTLEDVMVLGGFSVIGDSVCGSADDGDVAAVEKKLVGVYNKLCKGNSQKVTHGKWISHFVGAETGVEHEAFLCLWVSRFVLPCFPYDTVAKRFFRIAVYLARGVQIALAPVVLASIYRDLSLLNSVMQSGGGGKGSGKGDDFDDVFVITLWAPLQFVQVWAWERFPEFRPKAGVVECGEPRLARWHMVNEEEIGSVRPMLQSAGDSFEWRPYCKMVDNLPFPRLYKGKEEWVLVGEDLGEDVKAMARCLRVCELVGTDFIEQYNPHRVAMQFGFDQDVPQHVGRYLMEFEIPKRELVQLAWMSYTNPIGDEVLYVPSLSYQPHVTMRYLKWFRQGALAKRAAVEGVVRRGRGSKRPRSRSVRQLEMMMNEVESPPRTRPRMIVNHDTHERVPPDLIRNCGGNDLAVPPGFRSRLEKPKMVKKEVDTSPGTRQRISVNHEIDELPDFGPKCVGSDLVPPPGFPPKATIATKEAYPPAGFTPKSVVDHQISVPPGFLPKNAGTALGVPTVFRPTCDGPIIIDLDRNEGSVLRPTLNLEKECVESKGDGKSLLRCVQNSHTSYVEVGSIVGEKSTTVIGESSGKIDSVVPRCDIESAQGGTKIIPSVTHGRGLDTDGSSHDRTRLDIEARVSQLEKIVSAFKQAKLPKVFGSA